MQTGKRNRTEKRAACLLGANVQQVPWQQQLHPQFHTIQCPDTGQFIQCPVNTPGLVIDSCYCRRRHKSVTHTAGI